MFNGLSIFICLCAMYQLSTHPCVFAWCICWERLNLLFCVGAFAEGRSVEAQIAPSLRSRCCALPAARDLLVTSREGLVSRWGSQLPHDRKRAITEDKFNSALNDKWSNRSLSGSRYDHLGSPLSPPIGARQCPRPSTNSTNG